MHLNNFRPAPKQVQSHSVHTAVLHQNNYSPTLKQLQSYTKTTTVLTFAQLRLVEHQRRPRRQLQRPRNYHEQLQDLYRNHQQLQICTAKSSQLQIRAFVPSLFASTFFHGVSGLAFSTGIDIGTYATRGDCDNVPGYTKLGYRYRSMPYQFGHNSGDGHRVLSQGRGRTGTDSRYRYIGKVQ